MIRGFDTLIEIVDLQTDWAGAGAFKAVEDMNDINVWERARGFDEDGFLNPQCFGQVTAIAQIPTIRVICEPLLKEIEKGRAQLARIVDRTHIGQAIQH